MSAAYSGRVGWRVVSGGNNSRNYGRLMASVAVSGVFAALAYEKYNYNYFSGGNGSGGGNNGWGSGNGGGKGPFLKSVLGVGAVGALDDGFTNTRDAEKPLREPSYYQKVYNAIAQKLIDEDDHDDGSYGPVLVRLAWHNAGSYDQADKNDTKGGTYAGTMRFGKEQADPGNKGLDVGVKFLQSIKDEYKDISHGDLYTLAGVCAVQEMSGPKIAWRPGRVDLPVEVTPPYGRLPDATQTKGAYLREVFTNRLGFTDQELVVLIGVGHAIGRCHVENSGFDGPWTFSPITISNQFFKLLLSEDWQVKKWDHNKQYEDAKTQSLMMLPTDMVLKQDSMFRKYVEEYANDEAKCMADFSKAFAKLIERGCKFHVPPMYLKTLDEQGL